MDINPDILRRELIQVLKQTDTQIEEVNRHAAQMGGEGYTLRDANANWPMIPLLVTKAQIYLTLVQLQTKK